jgi:hypothetical protein
MPRSTISSRRAAIFDKNLELRNASNPAISAATTENPIQFPAEKYNFYSSVVHSSSYTGFVAGTSEWQAVIEVSTQPAGTYKQVGIATLSSAGGDVRIPLEGSYVEDILPGAAYIRVRLIKVGAPGSLTYGAFIAC